MADKEKSDEADDWSEEKYNNDWETKPAKEWSELDHRNYMHASAGAISAQQTQDENEAKGKKSNAARRKLIYDNPRSRATTEE